MIKAKVRLLIGSFILILCFACQKKELPLFTDVSRAAGVDFLPSRLMKGISFGGIAVIDYNNDGFEDVYVPGGSSLDVLYKNNGDGTFTNVIQEAGISTIVDSIVTLGVISADINNDGFTDLFITTAFPYDTTQTFFSPNILLLNNGNGTFKDISFSSNISKDSAFSGAACFGDINNDGFIDLYVSNLVSDREIFKGQLWDASAPK